jgi:hypothetical protein
MKGPISKEIKVGFGLDALEVATFFAGLLVVIGLLMESGPEAWTAMINRMWPHREVTGNALVTIGVFAEVAIGLFIARSAKRAQLLAEAQIAELNAETTAARERISSLNQIAEQERLARVKIEEELFRPHVLTQKACAEFTEALSVYTGRKRADVFVFDHHISEVFSLADSINGVFASARWNSKVWIGREPRITGREVTFAISRECPIGTGFGTEIQTLASKLAGVLFNLGIGTCTSLGGFTTHPSDGLPMRPLGGRDNWDPRDVAMLRVQIGQRQLTSDLFTRPITPPQP